MRVPNYKKATNTAYNALMALECTHFSTDVLAVIDELLPNCRALTYGQAHCLYGCPLNIMTSASEYGFSVVKGSKRVILYNEQVPLGCVRFTLAHEIGHAMLGHCEENDEGAEKEANCFARNLLCPVPVADVLGMSTTDEYVQIFDVSRQAAMLAVQYAQRDRYYADPQKGYVLADRIEAYMLGYDSLDAFYYQQVASL